MKNNGWVQWQQWTASGLVGFGRMPVKDVGQNLRKFEQEAGKIMRETGAAHVLYGVKLYDDDGDLQEVKFYLEPMDDARFEKDVASKTGVVVYALHNHSAGLFTFVLETIGDAGDELTETFSTASAFLDHFEEGEAAVNGYWQRKVAGITYGGNEVSREGIYDVEDLYCWMCSDDCGWFN